MSLLFDPAAEALFRRFEMEVLDVHHRTLPLWARPRGTALYAILSAFDARMPLILGTTETVAARHRAAVRFKDVEEGLSYAVRWLHEGSPTVAVVPTDDQAILGEADEFLVHAADYATLVEHHVRYGRGLLGLEVDAEARTVRFRFRAGPPVRVCLPRHDRKHRVFGPPGWPYRAGDSRGRCRGHSVFRGSVTTTIGDAWSSTISAS